MERRELARLILERAGEYFDNLSYRVDTTDEKHVFVDKVVLTISCEDYYVQQDFIVGVFNSFAGNKNEYIEHIFEQMLITLALGVFRKRG